MQNFELYFCFSALTTPNKNSFSTWPFCHVPACRHVLQEHYISWTVHNRSIYSLIAIFLTTRYSNDNYFERCETFRTNKPQNRHEIIDNHSVFISLNQRLILLKYKQISPNSHKSFLFLNLCINNSQVI